MKKTDLDLPRSYPVIIEEREVKECRKKWRTKRNTLTIIIHKVSNEVYNDTTTEKN